MKTLIHSIVSLFIGFSIIIQVPLLADVAESEPNDPCGTGISTNLIIQNETYTGSVDVLASDYDCWYFNAGSSGNVILNLQATLSARLVFYECNTDYCTDCTVVRNIESGSSNNYTMSSSKYYRFEIAQFGGGPGSGTYSVIISGDASLSVSLISFSAHVSGESIVLHWITESEVDNLGFILERSEDAKDWMEIASYQTHDALSGHGNNSSRNTYAYLDENVMPKRTYFYRLSDVNIKGEITSHAPISITFSEQPEMAVLEKAFPNPFNPQTYIRYQLSDDLDVNISVYDLLGRLVKELIEGHQIAGTYHTYWNGTDENGHPAPSGNYIICMQTEAGMQVQKVMLMK